SADALTEAGHRIKENRDLEGSALAALAVRLKGSGDSSGMARQSPRVVAAPPIPRAPAPQATVPQPAPSASVAERGGSEVRVESNNLDALLAASSQLMVAGDRVGARRQAFETLHDLADQCATEWSRSDHRVRLELERAGAPAAVIQAVNGMRENLR